jgi:hypothetical protein
VREAATRRREDSSLYVFELFWLDSSASVCLQQTTGAFFTPAGSSLGRRQGLGSLGERHRNGFGTLL